MQPDSILFWNAVALEANRVSHTDPDKREQNGPTLSSRAIAIVHLAMYDAYAGIVNDPTHYPRYLDPPVPAPAGGTASDAVAGAAYTTLCSLYMAQQSYFDAQLACFNTEGPSYEFGRKVGMKLIELRSNDMDARADGYRFSMRRGRHRVDPDNPMQSFHAPYYGAQNRGFAITIRHTLKPPPYGNGTDAQYLQALANVRARGIRPDLMGTLPHDLFDDRRTADQTVAGIYWAYDGASRLGTPPRFYNQIVRQVAMERGNKEGDNARLFAFVNAAMGDAGILAWEQKYCHDFWRPVLGIREHDNTLGPNAPYPEGTRFADGDPGWLPLGAPATNMQPMKNFTPNFPAYPSGHATFGAAALHMTRMFYGIDPDDKSNDTLFPKSIVSDEFNGRNADNTGTVRPQHTRSFPGGLWEMIVENALSRVFLGVHWIFDAFDFRLDEDEDELTPDLRDEMIGGVGLGLRIARDIFRAGNCIAPRMTRGKEAPPPIMTPPPGSPLPAKPMQPAAVGGCAGVDRPKGATEAAGRVQEAFPPQAGQAVSGGQVQQAYPSGLSEQ